MAASELRFRMPISRSHLNTTLLLLRHPQKGAWAYFCFPKYKTQMDILKDIAGMIFIGGGDLIMGKKLP